MAQAFFGGVHPNDMKAATNEKAIEKLAAPAEVVIPMSMHIGAPCKPIVAVGDKVTIGQKIGEPGGFVSAPIHASVSGTVKAVEPRPYSMGGNITSVVIENDMQDEVSEEVQAPADPNALSVEEMVEIVKNAGIVGQGGATFPTHVKISSGLGKVDYVIINAAECEPYITGDHRTCLERPEQVIKGATLLAKCFGVDKVYIGIEANKADAIAQAVEGPITAINPASISRRASNTARASSALGHATCAPRPGGRAISSDASRKAHATAPGSAGSSLPPGKPAKTALPSSTTPAALRRDRAGKARW